MSLFDAILTLALSAAPWVLLGLLAAALVHALLPPTWAQRWLGGNGSGSLLRAALVGAPLPLCSCGAIPTALALHRNGEGRGPSTAFLVSTPGIGVDAVALTWALFGPVMTVSRVTGAFVTALATGLAVSVTEPRREQTTGTTPSIDDRGSGLASDVSANAACDGGACCVAPRECRDHGTLAEPTTCDAGRPAFERRLRAGLRYAFVDLLDTIGPWLVAGLVLGGLLMAAVPPETLADVSQGWGALVVAALIGIPLYLCAAAATPIAAGLVAAGVSPGAALVFLIAAPVTSLATLGVYQRTFGRLALAVYLATIVVSTVLIGATLDWALRLTGFAVVPHAVAHDDPAPSWLAWSSLWLLGLLILRRPWAWCLARLTRSTHAPAEHAAITLETTLTCPECAQKHTECMPQDACQWFYECSACGALLKPKAGDCCVFCSYADHPCPPAQIRKRMAGYDTSNRAD